MTNNLLLKNIGELITLHPLAEAKKLVDIHDDDLGRLKDAWLLVKNGKISNYGPTSSGLPDIEGKDCIDARGGLVLPGLVDAHTHPIFAGDRSKEFCRRLSGESYQSIGASGGGIKYTVSQTRTASEDDLSNFCSKTLNTFLTYGVTTVEAKSGYGLSTEQELKLLRCIKHASTKTPQKIVATCLALHAVMPEYESAESYIDEITNTLLPMVSSESLASFVDAFVEKGYFSPEQIETYVQKAKELGLKIRIHADEFADSGAATAAAKWGALSADHLECASDEGISDMAKSGVIAILLPGTSLYTKIPYAQAERFRDRKCAVALATDFNPGSCLVDNLPFIATIGALHCGLTAAEAIAAVTYVAAASLGLEDEKGALAKGMDADLCLYSELQTLEQWIADLGRNPPNKVFIEGKSVL